MPHDAGGGRGPQRRVHRGGGRPTDGRLPPKKNTRARVKYRPPDDADADDRPDPGPPGDADGAARSASVAASVDDGEGDGERTIEEEADADAEEGEPDDPLLLELRHLQRRIGNIESTLQTSQGLANPATWRTNCLAPASNAVGEWRAILSHHLPGGSDDGPPGAAPAPREGGGVVHDTAARVFGLVQAALQSGPLGGSNPGYFKRCGADVAGTACEFLDGIVAMTVRPLGPVAASDAERGGPPGPGGPAVTSPDGSGGQADGDRGRGGDPDEGGDDDSTSGCGDDAEPLETEGTRQSPEHERTVRGLQTALMFTERQARRLVQWHANARNAANKGKPPSKSASRLQGQRSKKQRAKDLKRERRSGRGR